MKTSRVTYKQKRMIYVRPITEIINMEVISPLADSANAGAGGGDSENFGKKSEQITPTEDETFYDFKRVGWDTNMWDDNK